MFCCPTKAFSFTNLFSFIKIFALKAKNNIGSRWHCTWRCFKLETTVNAENALSFLRAVLDPSVLAQGARSLKPAKIAGKQSDKTNNFYIYLCHKNHHLYSMAPSVTFLTLSVVNYVLGEVHSKIWINVDCWIIIDLPWLQATLHSRFRRQQLHTYHAPPPPHPYQHNEHPKSHACAELRTVVPVKVQ